MLKYLLRALLLALCFLTFTTVMTSAQETTETMRSLADKNDFHVGAAVYTRHFADPRHGETMAREFNMLTPENEAKTCEVQPQLGTFTFAKLDQLVKFAEDNNMTIRGHTLLWHQCVPGWLETATFSREEAIGHLRDHIMTVVGRYKGRIAMWDVVNEAVADGSDSLRETPWHRLIGDDYIELAFQFAHEADPDALLFYNDYGAEDLGGKSDAVYNMVSDLLAKGVPIHGVGLQGHFVLGSINHAAIAENIKRLGELGLEVQFTELDIRYPGDATEDTLREQAADYRQLMQTCLEDDACTAFVVWGVTDRFTWLRDGNLGFYSNPTVEPLLFDEEYQPKQAYYAILDALARHAGEPPILSDEEVSALSGEAPSAITVEIPEPTKSDPAQLSPDSVTGAVYYAPFPVMITLDGETDDWANVPRVLVDSGPMIPQGSGTSMSFAAAADDKALYFLAEVKDSNLAYGTNDPATAWYQEDSVEFYLNTMDDLNATAYAPGIAQIAILAANITNPESPIIGGGNSGDAQISVKAVETADGYLIEASVPLETDVWSITPEHLKTLGFQVHLNGSSATERDTKLIWSVYDKQDQSYSNPSLFGRLIFWDVEQ